MTSSERPRRSRRYGLACLGLAVALVAGTFLPTTVSASHEIPRVLDQEHVTGEGGYAAWHIDVDPPQHGGWTPVHLHFGDHLRPVFRNASHAYFGFWLVNLDHNYVGYNALSTLETDGAETSVHTQQPTPVDRRVAIHEDRWEDWMGGTLTVKPGGWLAIAFWSTDGNVDAEMTLGSPVEDGRALVDLVAHTTGASTFSHENGEFDGSRNVNVVADVSNTCSISECGPARSLAVRSIQDGRVDQTVDHRLFGAFLAPGSDDDVSWERADASGSDRQRYVFHGAAPGTYSFLVDEYEQAGLEREPLVAAGADVRLPSTVPTGGSN